MANEQNLVHFKKGVSGNPKGRPKKLINVIKDLPADMKEKVFGVLASALQFKSKAEASAFIRQELGEYGIVMQIAVDRLTSEDGWSAMMDILDRIYGKPRQSAEVTHHAEGMSIIVNNPEEKEQIENLGELGI